jgi:hypothetical protein
MIAVSEASAGKGGSISLFLLSYLLFKKMVQLLPGGDSPEDTAPTENPGWFCSFDAVSHNRKDPEEALGVQYAELHARSKGLPKANQQGTHGCTIRA